MGLLHPRDFVLHNSFHIVIIYSLLAHMQVTNSSLTDRVIIILQHQVQICHTQLKILGGAPEDYRGERWATGDYSGRLGEEAHSSICPLILPDKILTGDLWWEQLRGPQWEKPTVGPGRHLYRGPRKRIPL